MNQRNKTSCNAWATKFPSKQNMLFTMPLYVHDMPSHVMRFFKLLEPSDGNIAFLVFSRLIPKRNTINICFNHGEVKQHRVGR